MAVVDEVRLGDHVCWAHDDGSEALDDGWLADPPAGRLAPAHDGIGAVRLHMLRAAG